MRLYHVGFMFKKFSPSKKERIDAAISRSSVDWLRYSHSTWIVFAENPDKVHIQVREAIDPDDNFLIVPIDMRAERQGLLPAWIWKWLDVDRTQPGWAVAVERIRETLEPPKLPPLIDFLSLIPPTKETSE